MKKSNENNNETKTVMKRKIRTAIQTVRKTKYKENSRKRRTSEQKVIYIVK